MGGADREGAQGRLLGAVNVLCLDLGGGYLGVSIWKTVIKLLIFRNAPFMHIIHQYKSFQKIDLYLPGIK